MREHAATVRLHELLSSLPTKPDAATSDAVHAAVDAFVDVAKEKGAPIERVIISIKEVAAEAGVRSSTQVVKIRAQLDARDQLVLDIVRWAVERYFAYQRPPDEGAGRGPKPPKHTSGGHEMAAYNPY